MGRTSTTDLVYGNCKVYSSNGLLMFLCGFRKAKWYLKNYLAEVLEEEPLSIRLTFKTRGKGHFGQSFYLTQRPNYCVVCGMNEDLSRFHVVPKFYRKYLHPKFRKNYSHDVVPLCTKCFNKTRSLYLELIEKLAENYDAPLSVRHSSDEKLRLAQKSLSALVNYHERLPEVRVRLLQYFVEDYMKMKIDEMPLVLMNDLLDVPVPKKVDYNHHARILCSKLEEGGDWFVNMWRSYFLEFAKPIFMPDDWDKKHNLENDGRPN